MRRKDTVGDIDLAKSKWNKDVLISVKYTKKNKHSRWNLYEAAVNLQKHSRRTHLCSVVFLLSVFPDLLRFTTILLPCCKGQTRTNGRPYLFFASSTPDILSFCPFLQRYISALSLHLYTLCQSSVFCLVGTTRGGARPSRTRCEINKGHKNARCLDEKCLD